MALGADALEQGPVMIRKLHAYLVKEVNLAENAEEKSAEFVNRVCQVTLEAFWTQKERGEEGFDRTDSMLEGLGAEWTTSFLAKIYHTHARYLIKRIRPSSSGSIDRKTTSLVRDVWSRKFCERTGGAAHRRSSKLAIRWTSNVDRDNAWKLGRTDGFDALPRADERKCEEN